MTVVKMHSTRKYRDNDGEYKKEEQTRYFISSLPCDAHQAAHAIRTHGSIENSLHWRPDMTFREDASRICKNHASENMALMRRIAAGLVKKGRLPKKMSVKRAQLIMTLDWDFALEHFLANN
jgi:predicted transposase YbfD/YdcC